MTGDANKADLYYKLAERSWNRFRSFRDLEWKTGAAIWSAFAVATVLVLTSEEWVPGCPEIIAGFLLVIVTAIGYYLWLQYLNEKFKRESQISYYWESHIRKATGVPFPNRLQPLKEKVPTRTFRQFFRFEKDSREKKPWPSAEDCDSTTAGDFKPETERELALDWHRAAVAQYVVAVLLACLLLGAICVKSYRHGVRATPTTKVTLEGHGLEIDSLSKFKLAPGDRQEEGNP